MSAIFREPIYDMAQLGHTELLTTDLEASARFFTEVYGMYVVEEAADALYLRAWGDEVLTSLKLTASREPGLGHVAWRSTSPQALERRVAAVEARGLTGKWIDGDVGHGKAYRFTAPGGHPTELYFETEVYGGPSADTSYLPNQPQAFRPHGVAVERIDHINLLVQNVPSTREFQEEVLGFKTREILVPTPEHEVGAWLSLMTKAHDLALTREPHPTEGRLHHLAYEIDSREGVLRAADIFLENGIPVEFGPAKHSRTQGFFLYVLEPGGNRVEVFAGGIHHFSPDKEVVVWTTEAGGRSTAWGLDVPPTFHSYASPPFDPPKPTNTDGRRP